MRLFISSVAILFGVCLPLLAQPASEAVQENGKKQAFDYVSFRAERDRVFQAKLDKVAELCDKHSLSKEAQLTRAWFIARDPKRQYIFLPPTTDDLKPAKDAEKIVQQWHGGFRKVRSEQAAWLLETAKKLKPDQAALAYRLLHEALHEDPDQAEARKLLGYVVSSDKNGTKKWTRKERAIRSRKVKKKHNALPNDLIWSAESAHFRVYTTGEKKDALYAIERFERWHDVWQQLFLEFWTTTKRTEALFDGTPISDSKRKHNIIIFRDKKEYIDRLSRSIPGIEISSGYYDPQQRHSFFYFGEKNDSTTDRLANEANWRHELTHQLFQELIRIPRSSRLTGKEHGVWALEGIAVYMESMRDFGPFCTAGGFESPRLQFARLHRFRERFRLSPESLMEMDFKTFQKEPNIAKIYPITALYCHYMMTGDAGRHRAVLKKYLANLYEGKGTAKQVLTEMNFTGEEFDKACAKFLYVHPDEINKYLRNPEQLTYLSLVPSSLTDHDLQPIGNATNLKMLDLTSCKIGDPTVNLLGKCGALNQLFLEGTLITDKSLSVISTLKTLQEVDLSRTSTTSAAIDELTQLSQLQVLWLTGTQVDDSAIDALSKMKKLQVLELTGTKVSATGIQKIKQSLPALKQ